MEVIYPNHNFEMKQFQNSIIQGEKKVIPIEISCYSADIEV